MKRGESVLKYHRPNIPSIYAARLTPENVHEIARELGGSVEDPETVPEPEHLGPWLLLPTLDGVRRLRVSDGPVVGRDAGTGQIRVWSSAEQFYVEYEQVSR